MRSLAIAIILIALVVASWKSRRRCLEMSDIRVISYCDDLENCTVILRNGFKRPVSKPVIGTQVCVRWDE